MRRNESCGDGAALLSIGEKERRRFLAAVARGKAEVDADEAPYTTGHSYGALMTSGTRVPDAKRSCRSVALSSLTLQFERMVMP